ncbi:hypothetical protein B0H11DRAFT_1902552 [Mycena galericulata]|nr:hypothetical protein B0H11DRAFT_1902552 [Mycena galericulata]
MLANFTLPGVCGKLPKELGLTSGGSLTADQWLLLATVYGPIVIPQLWSACIPEDFDVLASNRVTHIARQEAAQETKRRKKEAKALEKQKAKDAEKEAKKLLREQKKAEKEAEDQRKREERARKKTEKEGQGQGQPRERTRKKAEKDGRNTGGKDGTSADVAAANTGTQDPAAEPVLQAESSLESGRVPSPAPMEVDPVPMNGSTAIPPVADASAEEPDSPFALHPDDPGNFLKLSSALCIFQQEVLSDTDIDRADKLIRDYCKELIPSNIKPNHHYATHTAECVRNFGPLRVFWTFLFERLNKLLKSIKTNNHGNGELETTFFREFHQTCQLSRVRFRLSKHDGDSLPGQVAEVMSKASKEDRGTVAELANLSSALDRVHRDAKTLYELSPRFKLQLMSDETYRHMVGALTMHFPDVPVHCISDVPRHPNSIPLNTQATFHNYVIVNGRRYYASSAAKSNRGSLIQLATPTDTGMSIHCGELVEVFKFQQSDGDTELCFGRMRWFTQYQGSLEPIWHEFASHNVALWDIEDYLPWQERHPIIDLSHIRCHLARSVVRTGSERIKAWATILIKAVGRSSIWRCI